MKKTSQEHRPGSFARDSSRGRRHGGIAFGLLLGLVRAVLILAGVVLILVPAIRFPVAEMELKARPLRPITDEHSHLFGVCLLPVIAFGLCLLALYVLPNDSVREKKRPGLSRATGFLFVTLLFIASLLPGKNIDISAHIALRSLGSVLILLGFGRNLWVEGCGRLGYWLKRFLFESKSWVFITVVAGLFVVLCERFSGAILGHLPHVADSMSMCWQGKIFAAGRMALPNLPLELQPFFIFFYAVRNGQLFSIYPPGQPLLFALGYLAKIPYLVGPVLGGLTLAGFHLTGRTVYSDRVGRIAALAGATSPFLFLMSASFMSHTGTLFFITFGVWFLFRVLSGTFSVPAEGDKQAISEPASRGRFAIASAALCGACFGMAFLCRPYTTVAIGPVIVFIVLYSLIKSRSARLLVNLAVVGLVAALFLAGFLYYNHVTTGNPLVTGYDIGEKVEQVEWSRTGDVVNTATNLSALNLVLFAWPVPALFFVWWLFVSGRFRKWDIFLLLIALAQIIAYFFYTFQDLCFGPRFFYSTTLCWVLLSARGIDILLDGLERKTPPVRLRPFVAAVVVLCVGLNFARIVPNMKGYWMAAPDETVRLVEDVGIDSGLVLVDGWVGLPMTLNDISLDGDIVFAVNRGRLNRLLLDWYFDRDIWFIHEGSMHPARKIENAGPVETTNLKLLSMKSKTPSSAYAKVDSLMDESMMNRAVFLEKTPFLWSDLLLDESDTPYLLDVWGRIYRRSESSLVKLNDSPFRGQSRPLVAMSFSATPGMDQFVVTDHRGGVYWLDGQSGALVDHIQPRGDFLVSQVEVTSSGHVFVLKSDGELLSASLEGGYRSLAGAPDVEGVEFLMALIDEGLGAMRMDSKGALYPWGAAVDFAPEELSPIWQWEAARAIEYLGNDAYVIMDSFGSTYVRGTPPAYPNNSGLPYIKVWQYAVDLEVGSDGQTLYMLNRNGEVWSSR